MFICKLYIFLASHCIPGNLVFSVPAKTLSFPIFRRILEVPIRCVLSGGTQSRACITRAR